jgi:hypothetical protein
MEQQSTEQVVVQVIQNSQEGRALAEGFDATWRDMGRQAITRALPEGAMISKEFLQRLMEKDKPTVLLLWTDGSAVPALETLSAPGMQPRRIYLSSSFLKHSLWTIPEAVRDIAYLAYPYRLPQEETAYADYARGLLRGKNTPSNDRRISTKMYSLVRLMTDTLTHMQRNYYRDHFLDVISMSGDRVYPNYVRLSFGPGQRYASKGCYIVQVTKGPRPELVKKSNWVIY